MRTIDGRVLLQRPVRTMQVVMIGTYGRKTADGSRIDYYVVVL